MDIFYTFEHPQIKDYIFLSGPTYRVMLDVISDPVSWRKSAIKTLEYWGYEGGVCFPEWRGRIQPIDWTYDRQVDWEIEKLRDAKVILFWVPRNMKTLPALTTNVEFGEWLNSGKIVVGAPPEAEHVRYFRARCERLNIPWAYSLSECSKNAITMFNNKG